mgnify:CR=1 FL=1
MGTGRWCRGGGRGGGLTMMMEVSKRDIVVGRGAAYLKGYNQITGNSGAKIYYFKVVRGYLNFFFKYWRWALP